MRLLTHNLLACHARSCNAPTNFPLNFKDCTRVEIIEADFQPDFLQGFRSKIDWKALVGAAKQLGDTSLPEDEPNSTPEQMQEELDEELLKKLHHVLLEIHVQDGSMVCPSCGHIYVIRDSIPNMLLAEHEIRRGGESRTGVIRSYKSAVSQTIWGFHTIHNMQAPLAHANRVTAWMTENMKLPGRMIYGTAWKKERTTGLVVSAVRAGFRAIDTAAQRKHYNQPGLGEALQIVANEDGIKREQIWLQTKFTSPSGQDLNGPLPYDLNAPLTQQVQQSFETSLKELQTSYIDSVLLHSPERTVAKTGEALLALKPFLEKGVLRHIGISNIYDPVALRAIAEGLKQEGLRLSFIQNRFYAATGYDQELRKYCSNNGIVYQSFWTLTGNPKILASSALKKAADRLGITAEQAFYQFCIQEDITPLNGTTNVDRVKLGVQVLNGEVGEMNVEELASIRKMLQ